MVVDAGSAVTVDLVDGSGAFAGGAILPGMRLMAKRCTIIRLCCRFCRRRKNVQPFREPIPSPRWSWASSGPRPVALPQCWANIEIYADPKWKYF